MRRKADIEHELAQTSKALAEALQLIEIWKTRCAHADTEMAQARVSRDNYRGKLNMLIGRMKEQGVILKIVPTGAELPVSAPLKP